MDTFFLDHMVVCSWPLMSNGLRIQRRPSVAGERESEERAALPPTRSVTTAAIVVQFNFESIHPCNKLSDLGSKLSKATTRK